MLAAFRYEDRMVISKHRLLSRRWWLDRDSRLDAALLLACIGMALFGIVVAGWLRAGGG